MGTKQIQEILNTYESIQTYVSISEHALSPLITTVYLFGCSIALILASSCIILFHSNMNFIIGGVILDVAIFIGFGLAFCLQLEINCIRNSEELLNLLKKHCQLKRNSCKLKSFYPIRINFSNFFPTKAGTILTVFALISQNINSLVIMYLES